jgi:hypothetical protein
MAGASSAINENVVPARTSENPLPIKAVTERNFKTTGTRHLIFISPNLNEAH